MGRNVKKGSGFSVMTRRLIKPAGDEELYIYHLSSFSQQYHEGQSTNMSILQMGTVRFIVLFLGHTTRDR